MQKRIRNRHLEKRINNTVLAIKAARLIKGLSRRKVSELSGCSSKALEQIENGRCGISPERTRRIVAGMGMDWPKFEALAADPQRALAQFKKAETSTLERRPRRNLYKVITKEIRILKILRRKKGISQSKASKLCGFSNSMFGLIENGRTDLKKTKIEFVIKRLGYQWSDFEKLMSASILRDEMMKEAVSMLERLDDDVLVSTISIIKALQRKGE